MTYTTRTVDSRTLSAGDIVIATPSSIGGRLKAQITENPVNLWGSPNEGQFRATTLEVLEATDNGRTRDLSRTGVDGYVYDHGNVELVVPGPEWVTVDRRSLSISTYVRATRIGDGVVTTGVLTWIDHAADDARITKDDGRVVRINPSARRFEVQATTPNAPVPGPVTWTAVYEGEVSVGDYVRARNTDRSSEPDIWHHTGEVTSVEDEFLGVRSETDGRTRTVDMDYHYVERRDRSVVSVPDVEPLVIPITGTAYTQAPVQWHRIAFSDLRVGDVIRATMPATGAVKEGTVATKDSVRAVVDLADGGRESMSIARKFEVSNRVPDSALPLQDQYPTIHHLKAAIFDVVRANYANGDWCGQANSFVRELDIIDDLYSGTLTEHQNDEVKPLIAKLQSEAASGHSVSNASIDAAFQALGLPRHPEPTSRRYQLEVEVDSTLTLDQLRAMLQGAGTTLVRDPQEVSR